MATLSILAYNLPQRLEMQNDSDINTPPVDSENAAPTNKRPPVSLSKTFQRITTHNVLSESSANALNISNNSNVNTIVRKIKDFGMFGSVNGATGISTTLSTGALTITARRRISNDAIDLPTPTEKKATSSNKKPKLSKDPHQNAQTTPKSSKKIQDAVQRLKAVATASSTPVKKIAGTPGRKGLPLPQAVARRNARERNRVKQVNNGFAALRERIPEEVAEAFEAQGNGRGTIKKLSKVETLRMAVEYIRSLERLLGFDFPVGSDRGLSRAPCSSSDESFTLIKDEFDALSPSHDENYDDSLSNYDIDEYLNDSHATNQSISQVLEDNVEQPYQLDMLPSITTLNGLQYIRIPGTNTFQLLTPDIFVGNSNSPPNSSIDDEPFTALIDTNCVSPAISAAASTTSSAEPHSSPPSIAASTATAETTATAPAAQQQQQQGQHPAVATENGECCVVRAAVSALSRSSPVPQMQTSPSSPTAVAPGPSMQQPRQRSAMLSPACDNEPLLQTYVEARRFVLPTTTRLLLPHANTIKQEQFNDDATTDLTPTSTSPLPNIFNEQEQQMYSQQQQQQQLMLGHASLSTSPAQDRCIATSSAILATSTQTDLQVFYEHEPTGGPFYDRAIGSFKNDYKQALLETPTPSGTSCTPPSLSDENMIEVIDWWEAHTPKSDAGAAML